MAMVVAAGMTMTVGHTHNNQLKAAAEEMMLSPNAENCNDDDGDGGSGSDYFAYPKNSKIKESFKHTIEFPRTPHAACRNIPKSKK